MTLYTVQFNSAILELATVSSLEQECFQGTLENWRGTHQLEFCWQPVPCWGWQQKTPWYICSGQCNADVFGWKVALSSRPDDLLYSRSDISVPSRPT